MTYHSGNQLIDPYLLFNKAQLQPGMHAADFGCGRTGHLVFPASVIVGEHGVVYAVDILKEVLEIIKKRAQMDNLLNVHPVWADLERIGQTAIPEKSLDVVFILNNLFQSRNREAILFEAKRLTKEKARIIVVDWSHDGLPFGPRPEQFVDFNKIKAWAKANDLVVQEEFEAGRYHKGVVFYKQE